MDDKALETLTYNCDPIVSEENFDISSIFEIDQALETANCDDEQNAGYNDLMDESSVSGETEEICSDQEQNLPILQKMEDLINKVHILRKQHTVLCNEVKDINPDSFPGSNVLNAIQTLNTEHELLKKKHHEECEHLKRKYLEESSQRKQLYNEVIELKGNIRVFCRCRPLNQDEIANGSQSVVDFDPSQENELHLNCSDSSKKQFKFDHVFSPEDKQEAVFIQTLPIVTSVLDGYNVCIFAYGQTGTGKTFTMEGTPENRGVNYRTLEELFRMSNERSSIMRYELFVSMLEVYNEKIRDLLVDSTSQPAKKLEIKQSAEGTQEVPGLIEAHVYGTDEVWELLQSGSKARSVGSTNANELSSRSHCLLRVTVMGENLINGQRTRSHLWLVDLAGSERVGRIEVEGERLKESQFINKSLSALGDVISALASKTSHVPYRNSKLTHMLQSSLGGDCKTLMFVQISPSASDLGETLCSLNFASRVRGIEHGPARKQADLSELYKYKQLVEKAKHDEKETKKLQDNLQSFQLRLAAREQICRNLQEKVRDLENQLAEERKIRLKQESRALAAVSAQPQKTINTTEKKPPLGPSRLRMPLRRISNFMPSAPPSILPPRKTRPSLLSVSIMDKENVPRTSTSTTKGKALLKPRRGSIAVRPPPPPPASSSNHVLQPKRRASIATFRSESNPSLMTPLSGTSRARNDRVMGRQSFVWDPQRVWRTSRVSSPLQQVREEAGGGAAAAAATVEATPIGPRSSKFMGSPPSQLGSWKPKHPTVVALQRKHFVWSPLKLKSMKAANRKSFI